LPVRHHDWIAHFTRRMPNNPAVIDVGSERISSPSPIDHRLKFRPHLSEFLSPDEGHHS
jgi:hypothetical protein